MRKSFHLKRKNLWLLNLKRKNKWLTTESMAALSAATACASTAALTSTSRGRKPCRLSVTMACAPSTSAAPIV